ncbi:hypothetical protein ASE01_19950 [Nocardioides sp. Root190]|uniref:hypothetical protein n=1 Tax=Nocardioides sp. Root190 TaxID=1736488 RepID=UPI0006F2390A|nr:hypothetical protein [Nocardioides sp. Root190]KRB73051.1 hypothetical protein ASE01_19950 [Nocardioides sp. Root190]
MSAVDVTAAQDELGNLKSNLWQAVRDLRNAPTADNYDAVAGIARALESACEEFRKTNVPNALEVFVTCDHKIGQPLSIWARFASGVECIYEAAVSA